MHCVLSAPVSWSHFLTMTLKSFQLFGAGAAAALLTIATFSPNPIPAATIAIKHFDINAPLSGEPRCGFRRAPAKSFGDKKEHARDGCGATPVPLTLISSFQRVAKVQRTSGLHN